MLLVNRSLNTYTSKETGHWRVKPWDKAHAMPGHTEQFPDVSSFWQLQSKNIKRPEL